MFWFILLMVGIVFMKQIIDYFDYTNPLEDVQEEEEEDYRD